MTAFRIGFGYDVHRLVPGRPLILGGVRIPSERGLAGHSDADVLLHAIADALLGAAALGDIGQHFPDTDPRWKDADSLELLRQVYHQVVAAGYEVANVDSTVVLERPRLRPYIDAMRANIARVLDLPIDAVSVKATTSEGMGFVGTGEGAVAFAVCLLRPRTVES
ncbi:2-C-methyl-D-erythritol 2,4-cyclodiphosphate synthase [Rhodothermus marinus]|uniref:2-C-methyl-D-erythritol 2,4-cyclodiphosphate synthase n=1 Tax=Rhodothermus marinus TaxID=29549 RepID=UPI0037CC7A29